MKKFFVCLLSVCLPLLVACSGGGLFNPEGAVNYNGYQFETRTAPSDVRAVAGKGSLVFAGTGSGLYLGNSTTADPGLEFSGLHSRPENHMRQKSA